VWGYKFCSYKSRYTTGRIIRICCWARKKFLSSGSGKGGGGGGVVTDIALLFMCQISLLKNADH
jgi:hypothetical protein